MKTIACLFLVLLATCAPTSAQSGITSTWRAEGVGAGAWTVALSADGPRLTGRVSSCTSLAVEISDGRIDGNLIAFKCTSVDGDRVVSLTGRIEGDEIAFAWSKQVRSGGASQPVDGVLDPEDANAYVMFGPTTPPQFTARRVPEQGAEFATAVNLVQKNMKIEGTLFLPPGISRVRAVIVLLNSGTAWDGMGGSFYRDSELRKLSQTLECGLFLPRITNIRQGTPGPVLRNAGLGGDGGLLLLLQRLAQESGHQEITDAPLLLWSHSRTGHFAATFAALHPQRTIAFVQYHTGGSGLAGPDLKVLSRLPALLIAAKGDIAKNRANGWRGGYAEDSWRDARFGGAPWTYAVEPDAEHQNPNDLKTANALVIPWITAVLRQRLSPDGSGLRTVTEASGWLANIQTREAAPAAAFSAAKREANWLPDEQSARGWRTVSSETK